MKNWLNNTVFRYVHGKHLVYNTCWEDPRIDRIALELKSHHEVLVITSAGCNALDYLLAGAKKVYAVDLNFRQNALLELKIAAIRALSYEQFFSMFGRGKLVDGDRIYRQDLRPLLSKQAQQYWDKFIIYFEDRGWRNSFYFHGSTGFFARCINWYIDQFAQIREYISTLLSTSCAESRSKLYEQHIKPVFWTKLMRAFSSHDVALALLGVPQPQRKQIEKYYEGGVSRFMQDSVETVLTKLPMSDNYFWRVYLTGEYTPECCPEYLKEKNFLMLKEKLWDRIQISTESLTEFMEKHPTKIDRFVMLDHMDWLSSVDKGALQAEWQALLRVAAPDARVIWRSGGLEVDYIDSMIVPHNGKDIRIGDILSYKHALAQELHKVDRVHTYGSFYIADLSLAA